MRQKGFAPIIITLLILVAISAVGYFGYLKGYVSFNFPKSTPLVIPQPAATPDPTANWKTYSNPKYNLSFKYPSSWNLEIQTAPHFTLKLIKSSNKVYQIVIVIPDGWGPDICLYTKDRQIPQSAYFDIYQDIQSSDGYLMRRSQDSKNSSQNWTICIKESDSNEYVTALPFEGFMHYMVEKPASDEILQEMDLILSTFKFTQ